MMQSPIDDRVWKYMFHTIAIGTSAAFVYSLWRERRDGRSKLDAALKDIKQRDEPKVLAGMQSISATLEEELRTKKGVSLLTARSQLKSIVARVKFDKSSEENEVCVCALRLIKRICNDPTGRRALYQANGYRAIVLCLAEAHKNGHIRAMEEASKTLEEVTSIDPSDIVLPPDVPVGSEGAAEIAGYSSTTKMLRVLDPTSRVSFLSAVTGALANIATLRKGTKALQHGTDGKKGVCFFFALFNHSNEAVVEKAARAVRFLANHGTSQHDVIAEVDNVKLIVELIQSSPLIQHNVLRLIHIMIHSPSAKPFFDAFGTEDGFHALFRVWTKGADKVAREMAESLVHMLEKLASTSGSVHKLMDAYRPDIMERRAKDEDARKKQMEQMRQQQMMRQAVMQQMMRGGGMDMMGGDDF